MKKKFLALLLGGAFILGIAAPAVASQHGPPGPGNSHNGKCIGKPSDRIGGCK